MTMDVMIAFLLLRVVPGGEGRAADAPAFARGEAGGGQGGAVKAAGARGWRARRKPAVCLARPPRSDASTTASVLCVQLVPIPRVADREHEPATGRAPPPTLTLTKVSFLPSPCGSGSSRSRPPPAVAVFR